MLMATRRRGRPREEPIKKNSFSKWASENDMNSFLIADAIGCSRSTIYGLLDGSRMPSRDLAVRIEKFTRGEVKVLSWVPLKFRQK